MTDLLVATAQILIVVGIPAALILVIARQRHRQRTQTLELVRSALEADRTLPPELVEALAGPSRAPAERDRRQGVLLLGAGAGLLIVGLLAFLLIEMTGGQGSLPVGVSIAALGAIPACMGVALLILARGGGR